jgi:hypothetical protein
VGTKKWLNKVDLNTPLFYDTAHTKSKQSGERYAKYMQASTVGEDKKLNAGPHLSADAQYDFKHGHLRLLAVSALHSLPIGLQRVVLAVRSTFPTCRMEADGPLALEELASLGVLSAGFRRHGALPVPASVSETTSGERDVGSA